MAREGADQLFGALNVGGVLLRVMFRLPSELVREKNGPGRLCQLRVPLRTRSYGNWCPDFAEEDCLYLLGGGWRRG